MSKHDRFAPFRAAYQAEAKKHDGPKYWRSLDQFYQTSEFQKWVNQEFPTTGAEMLDEPSRRNVMKVMAASFALAGLTACRRPVEHILPNAKGVEGFIHGRPNYYNTAMTLGGAAMGPFGPVLSSRQNGRHYIFVRMLALHF